MVLTVLEPKGLVGVSIGGSDQTGLNNFSFPTTGALQLPKTGISTLSLNFSISDSSVNDQYIGLLMKIKTQPLALAPVPTASCPCWEVPRSGLCEQIKLPIFLSTIPRENPFAPNVGVSYSQCIDPANFDPYTGRMAMSYCWRYACLPNE